MILRFFFVSPFFAALNVNDALRVSDPRLQFDQLRRFLHAGRYCSLPHLPILMRGI